METLQGKLERCSINTATLGHREPIQITIERIAKSGFGGIAPWRSEVEGQDVAAVGKQIRDAGLTVSGYCRSTYLPALEKEAFRANVEANKRALHDAAELNARCFVMVVGGIPEGSRDIGSARGQVHDGVAELLEVAKAMNVPLALEPLHPVYASNRSVLNTVDQALEMCELIDPSQSGYLGVAVDAYHCWWDPNLSASIADAGRSKRILAYHVCDWLYDTQDVLLDRGMMGDGVVDLLSLRRSVETAGYAGLVEVEIFSKENWWKRDVEEVLSICGDRLQRVC
ncbi:sugar phosphate isomerase/epimerase family protein [Pseudomonas asiatica]|uniref:sugar phosphate isomerase/epimerase family protein n=1 Tax=Pseudomonas asiatica TaxID=2219225 RepID=UPI002E7AF4BD|nr:sugar phosphate isomerase/epimerase family protein [Pseudomonas asiatica]MEE1919971.1 sugar phosphate isomerase/epimerase family protein [Pseudomonas asiatica]